MGWRYWGMAAGRAGAGGIRRYSVKPGKSILEKLWDDLTGISYKLVSESDKLKKSERNRLAGKAEGIAWCISRMMAPYSDQPETQMILVRECVGSWLEARETGKYPLAEMVPWRHPGLMTPGMREG